VNAPNRRPCITEEIGKFAISVSFVEGKPYEVFFVKRGKSGTEIEELLHDLGVAASKIMQGEEP
jgi:hypothetical protein